MTKSVLHVTCVLIFCGTVLGDQLSDQEVSEAANCFTLNVYKELTKTNENLVSSPFSLDVLLSMLYAGAGGKTAQELSTSLGYNDLSVEDMENSFQAKLDQLNSSDGNALETANSIWIQKDLGVKQSFKDIVSDKFYSQEKDVDFAGDSHGTTVAINSWGNDKTHGLIPTLLEEDVEPSTVMALVNAIYFKGQWASTFPKENTRLGNFKNNGLASNPSSVQMMNQRSRFSYRLDKTLNTEILEMDYTGEHISMLIMLPRQGSNVDSLEQSLTCETFKSSIRSGYSNLVDVTMPKFELSSSFDLIKTIKDLGIKSAFSPSANFSGIAPGIYFSKAIQKAVIKVYEEGSEAAVLTFVGFERSSGPKELVSFRADRPFIFLIRDQRTNLILFMGRVKSLPNAS